MSNLCKQQYNTLFLPPMFFFLMFCYLFRPISFELLADLTLKSNPIWVTSTILYMLVDVCLCMTNICLRSTCTELTWIVNSWSMKDLDMLLQKIVGNKLFIASSILDSCICLSFSCHCISRPLLPLDGFVFMIFHATSCVEPLATLRTEEPDFSLVHLSVMVLKCSCCIKISLT